MPVILSSLFGVVGNFFQGLFSFKGEQSQTVQEALKALQGVNQTDAQYAISASQALKAIMDNGSFLEKNWRPLFMSLCLVIIASSFFGYVPPHLNDNLSPMMERLWTSLEIGLVGYMPLRTVEKVLTQMQIGTIVKTLVQKRVG